MAPSVLYVVVVLVARRHARHGSARLGSARLGDDVRAVLGDDLVAASVPDPTGSCPPVTGLTGTRSHQKARGGGRHARVRNSRHSGRVPAPPRSHRARLVTAACLSAVALVAAACSTGTADAPTGSSHRALPASSGVRGTGSRASAATPPAPATTTTTEQPGWTPVTYQGSTLLVDERAVVTPGGAHVELIRFRAGVVHFALHDGSVDPPHGAVVLPADAQPAVPATEQATMVGAFNGGFLASTGSGGFEVDGRVLEPLVAGRASFVIDANGTAHVGVWGAQLPRPGEQVVSVRQNLAPLVAGGVPSPTVGDVAAWGATLGGGVAVARSAVGEDAAGDIIYAGSMSATPADMADALVQGGVVSGMELDINPEWVQAVVAPVPGGALQTAVPGQNRPADQYLVGWTRDFVVASAA